MSAREEYAEHLLVVAHLFRAHEEATAAAAHATDELHQSIAEAYRAGVGPTALAQATGFDRSWIHTIVNRDKNRRAAESGARDATG